MFALRAIADSVSRCIPWLLCDDDQWCDADKNCDRGRHADSRDDVRQKASVLCASYVERSRQYNIERLSRLMRDNRDALDDARYAEIIRLAREQHFRTQRAHLCVSTVHSSVAAKPR